MLLVHHLDALGRPLLTVERLPADVALRLDGRDGGEYARLALAAPYPQDPWRLVLHDPAGSPRWYTPSEINGTDARDDARIAPWFAGQLIPVHVWVVGERIELLDGGGVTVGVRVLRGAHPLPAAARPLTQGVQVPLR